MRIIKEEYLFQGLIVLNSNPLKKITVWFRHIKKEKAQEANGTQQKAATIVMYIYKKNN